MRPDLDKCTTERPRSGGSLASCYKIKFGGTVPIHPDPEHDYPDEFGGYKSSARHRHHESKNFTDALGALRGNIRKNVGRPWDKVYSEFCQNLDRRGVSGHHIWTHLMDEVELNTIFLDGDVYSSTKKLGYRGDPVTGYYVHPVTGILEHKPYKRRRYQKPKEEVFPVPGEEGWHYRQIDGLWFKLREELVPSRWLLNSKTNKYGWSEDSWVISEKKSANRKEISWIKERMMQG